MTEIELDVRPMAPRDRHPAIFDLWGNLAEGGSFRLVNDHDPLPLYFQFACENAGTFRWDYLERGPSRWEVRLCKGQFADPGFVPPQPATRSVTRSDQPVVLDTRPIFARGETPCGAIEDAVAQVGTGQKLVLLVPFEPVPLYAKLARQGFKGDGQPMPDGSWRMGFVREAAGEGGGVACDCGSHF
jgi:uncharacterized protein (DUF2249 family)